MEQVRGGPGWRSLAMRGGTGGKSGGARVRLVWEKCVQIISPKSAPYDELLVAYLDNS